MNSVELMVAEHDYILRLNEVIRIACTQLLEGKESCKEDVAEDFRTMISFARNYADKHHHGKEEQILFKEMVQHLGDIGINLITHGMLVEHDLGRLFIYELEAAVNEYEVNPTTDTKLDIIANGIGYTKLLRRHIDKENNVVYPYAEKHLAKEVLDEVNAETEIFERNAEEKGIQEEYIKILEVLENKYK